MKTIAVFQTFLFAFSLLLFSMSCSKEDPEPEPPVINPKPDPDPNPDPDPDPDPMEGTGWIVDTDFKATGGYVKLIRRMGNGQFIIANDTQVGRANADGSRDESFPILTVAGGTIKTLALPADGKILVGGDFKTISGQDRPYIARINANGTVDTGFKKQPMPGTSVNAIAVQSDGKILMGGDIAFDTGVPMPGGTDNIFTSRLVRLRANGAHDPTFSVGNNGATWLDDGVISDMRLHEDGSIMISGLGLSGTVGSTFPEQYTVHEMLKVKPDGTIDGDFKVNQSFIRVEYQGGPLHVGNIERFIPLSSGDFLVGGDFNELRNPNNPYIRFFARVGSTGTVDTEFGRPLDLLGERRLLPVHALLEFSPNEIIIGCETTTEMGIPIIAIGLDGSYVNDFWHPAFAFDRESNEGYMLRGSKVMDMVRDSESSIIVAGMFIQKYENGATPAKNIGLIRLIKKTE